MAVRQFLGQFLVDLMQVADALLDGEFALSAGQTPINQLADRKHIERFVQIIGGTQSQCRASGIDCFIACQHDHFRGGLHFP